jgi:hypothetical protein
MMSAMILLTPIMGKRKNERLADEFIILHSGIVVG